MEIKAYIATLNVDHSVEVRPCNEIPDFIHAVIFDNERGIELYFSANIEWTPEQERLAFEQILINSLASSPEAQMTLLA